MYLVKPQIHIPREIFQGVPNITTRLARYARECYQSEVIDTFAQQQDFIRRIIQRGHESVLEHEKITMHWTCDRGVSHELVRARLASYSQESQRYVDYSKTSNGLAFISPVGFDRWKSEAQNEWIKGNSEAEKSYFKLRAMGIPPQDARDVLTNACRTRIIITMNIRELRHTLRLRSAAGAHPKFQALAIPLVEFLTTQSATSVLFEDITPNPLFDAEKYGAEIILSGPLFDAAREDLMYDWGAGLADWEKSRWST